MDYFGIKPHQAGVGNVYYVIQAAQEEYADTVDAYQKTYSDGSSAIQNTITTALTASQAERNDYIIVFPDPADYDEGATLTMNKASVHLICPAGIGGSYGCSTRAATIDPNAAAAAITITGRGVEVAGFWIRGYTEKVCITNSGVGVWIHHNDCAVTCTTSVAGGIYTSGVGSTIEKNFIFSNSGAGTWLYGISAPGGATRTHVIGNVVTVGNASTCTDGITMAADNGYMQMGVCSGNQVVEVPDCGGGVGTATLSHGITTGVGVLTTDNRVAIATHGNAYRTGGVDMYLENYASNAIGGQLAYVGSTT